MAIIDCCTFNNEHEIWDIHYNVLKDHVDEFIVLEFDKTFSGQPRKQSFPVEQYPDVKHYFIEEDFYEKYRELAESSPNTRGADHWKREFMQKECIKDALQHLKDDDIAFIGDVDEIWDPNLSKVYWMMNPLKLKLRVYTYFLNNLSSEEFNGTLVAEYKQIKDECFNHLRSNAFKGTINQGWHFTSMGGKEALKQKILDSYTGDSYATETVLWRIEFQYGEKDFLARNFTYKIDTSEWPGYLKKHGDKYKNLLKPV